MDRLAEFFRRDLIAGKLLHLLGKFLDLALPFEGVLLPLHLRHIHDVHGDVLAQYLVGLLLPVAGSLANVHIGDAEEGAGTPQPRPHGCLYQRTGAFGKHGLAARHPELRTAAQTGDDTVCRDDHFVRDIDAEGTEDLAPLFLFFYQFGGPNAVDLGNHQIPEVHRCGTVFLGQKDIAYRRRQNLAEQIMILQVHSQILPHLYIIRHNNSSSSFFKHHTDKNRLLKAA
ncbi:hypothetical protein SDC9_97944 [bioreactor metagenome]|uniref:Uncharacterized protein n=1 Tax=bioreactor metagenome TaxID=1076179 RepID=A0A645ADT9_9ZZZZ